MELWSWLYGDLDDFCAERCRDFCILILTFKHPSQIGPDSSVFVLQEASELSSLKPQLEELGVPLVAVVKENLGSEIQDFRPHFAGDIYIDEEVGCQLFYIHSRQNTRNIYCQPVQYAKDDAKLR